MRGETFLQKTFSPHPSSKNSYMAGGSIGASEHAAADDAVFVSHSCESRNPVPRNAAAAYAGDHWIPDQVRDDSFRRPPQKTPKWLAESPTLPKVPRDCRDRPEPACPPSKRQAGSRHLTSTRVYGRDRRVALSSPPFLKGDTGGFSPRSQAPAWERIRGGSASHQER